MMTKSIITFNTIFYTVKCRGTAHNISNLRCKIPKNILVKEIKITL